VRDLLDLIQEFAVMNEAKTLARGVLPPAEEKRWGELKRFYDLVMAQDGLAQHPVARFTAAQIREKVAARKRLRVRTDMETVVVAGSEVYHVRVGNLSRGGALLRCDASFDVGSRLTLHLASLGRGQALLPADGDVVWQSDGGPSSGTFRYRLGLQFVELDGSAQKGLDTLVVDGLEAKLLSLRREALDAEFLRRERVAL
jgi:hypothetical protein